MSRATEPESSPRSSLAGPSSSPGRRAWVEILLFGGAGGLAITALELSGYRFLVVERRFEIYAVLVAVLFAGVGLWLGTTLRARRGPRRAHAPSEGPSQSPFEADPQRLDALGITPRELEVLGLVARGLSNREIGDRLHISENTVKTHSSRLFDKLGARRRTQAARIGREQGLIP